MLVLSDDRPDVVILPDSWRTSDVFAESCEGGIFQDISGLLPNYENIMAHTADVSWDALDIFNDGRIWGMCMLRHNAASMMVQNSIPLTTIAAILGHAETRTTDIYITADISNLKECVLPLAGISRKVNT